MNLHPVRARLASPLVRESEILPTRLLPKISSDYTLMSCKVFAHNLDDPNVGVYEIVCTPEIWALIETDPDYNEGIVGMWTGAGS